MKIGFIGNQEFCVSGLSNGIRMQAMIWKKALEDKGHEVILISTWDTCDWSQFDVIHIYSYADSISFVEKLKSRGCKIVISPIIDSTQDTRLFSLYSRLGSSMLGISSSLYRLRNVSDYVDVFLARSENEKKYIESLGINSEKIKIIPLSYRNEGRDIPESEKEAFCLHCSSITQKRKNVKNLIKAAIKYKFNLVLAGSTKPQKDFEPLQKLMEGHDNIKCLGFVTDSELEDLYRRAKVFALPSIREGVGLVALEAAMNSCEIVITNIGGPKEYFGDYAYRVSPFSVDDIGNSVLAALKTSRQPSLRNYIQNNFNINLCIDTLINVYQSILI